MNIEYVGRTHDIDDRLRELAEEKLKKLGRFLAEPVEARIELAVEKHRQVIDLHVSHRSGTLHANHEGHDLRETLTEALDSIQNQAQRGRKRDMDKRRRASRSAEQESHWPVEVLDKGSVKGGEQPRVIKSSRIQIKPMSIEEAALSLEDSEHDFVVFRDSLTDRVNVLFRRKDQHYGLIAPEF
jgi:putative sigma-54 modulation protein